MEFHSTKCPRCKKGEVQMQGTSSFYFYTCSRAPKCKWSSGGIRTTWYSKPKKQQAVKKKQHRREIQHDSPELVAAIREECERRMVAMIAEREKFPPSLLKKGKRWVSNPKFTKQMREHMHTFAFTAEQVRQELIHA